MNILDIITIVIALGLVVSCLWKGLLKIALRFGALIVSGVVAWLVGPAIGERFFSNLIKEGTFSVEALTGEMLQYVNEAIGVILGMTVSFIVVFIVLRVVVKYLSKLLKKITKTSVIDHLLGGLFGLLAAFVLIILFAKVVNVVAAVTVLVDPSSEIFDMIDSTVFFKYFV